MRFMNSFDIESAQRRYATHPVLGPATQTLADLADWADQHSDGWAHWPKPARSAAKLMELIQGDGTWAALENVQHNATPEAYRKAVAPIKAFRTRQGADFPIQFV